MLAAGATDTPIVRTPSGSVRGTKLATSTRFLGVPFAKPPVGPLRFKAPQDVEPWPGVRDALAYASSPLQKPLGPKTLFPDALQYSEDALYLNIWAPSATGPHPVYVFIHGGGNIGGTSAMPIYDGEHFAANGIVFVSITYRVGVFGFLDVSKLLGDAYKGSGNNGLLDQIKALQWIKHNIAAFGGDPRNVTVGGQSAGAKNVIALMVAPQAKGLFHKAISESGGGHTFANQQTAHELADSVLKTLGATDPQALLSSTGDALLAAQYSVVGQYPRKFPFRSVIDNVVLDSAPFDAVVKGRGADIPLLLGYCSDEMAFYGPSKNGDGAITAQDIGNMPLDQMQQLYTHYPQLYPGLDNERLRYKAVTAESYFIPTIRLAQARAKTGARSYLYNFNLAPDSGKFKDLVVHGSELPLTFDNLNDSTAPFIGPMGPTAQGLSKVMHQAWLTFIRHGKNVHAGGLDWPAYSLKERSTMVFDKEVRISHDLQAAECELWSKWTPVA
ncbi:carboxylesterase family protein [Pseudomonas silvicola]|nr:carboxylesterase family protein [Pseudomonas silvicola]